MTRTKDPDAKPTKRKEPTPKKKVTRNKERGENVVKLFGDDPHYDEAVNVADMVPVGGGKTEDGDERVRSRIRLGKRWTEIVQHIKRGDYTWEDFVETLSPSELARGQLKDAEGMFRGRPPAIVPRAFHDACVRELMRRGQHLYRENYIEAITAMTAIAKDEDAKDSDRIKAAQFVIERLEGKVPDKLEISAADPWQTIISGIVAKVEDEQIAHAQEYLERREG
jgi:hypothetical protein